MAEDEVLKEMEVVGNNRGAEVLESEQQWQRENP